MAPTTTKVGPYVIDRELGRGGMGVVYAGRHEVTGLGAAVKTVTDAESRRLFQIRREVDALARLSHPGVVRILEHGVDGGFPWYAMELLDGLTLSDVHRGFIQQGLAPTASGGGGDTTTISPSWSAQHQNALSESAAGSGIDRAQRTPAAGGHLTEAMGLVVRLCETLAFVHGEGIVHRDLKPSNIFVTSRGLPILVDFGLVAHVGDISGREVLDDTWVAGSCQFIAPEQIRGELLDPRADLYSLGCVMYLLLTGRPPFDGDTQEIITQHLQATAAQPSTFVTGVPPELDQLVMRLLAKRRGDRVGHAHDIAASLQRMGVTAPTWEGDLPRTRTYLFRPPLVGRRAVLDQIEEQTRGLSDGKGGIVLLGGESGVGKTRVALEIASRVAARGRDVVTSVCSQSQPLGPLRPLLQHIADYCGERGTAVSDQLVGDRGPLLAAYEPALLHIPGQEGRETPTPLPQAAARARLFRALSETLAAYTANVPTLLVVDDLQWADELTGAFLDHLAAGPISTMGLVVLGMYRSEERTPALETMRTAAHTVSLTLNRLSTDYVGAMVAGMLSLPTPPPAFVRFLADKTEGNPFFLAEYLRTAVAEQVLIRTRLGYWTFAESDDPTDVICESLPLPRSLREIIGRRLDTLTPLASVVLRSATVIGREFDLGVLQQVADIAEHELAGALTELVDRHVIETAEAGGFRISHDKLREIPYAALADDERRSLHGRVATALDALHQGDARYDGVVGDHWASAGQPAKAAPYLERAGDRALTLYAPADAIGFYRGALAALESSGATGPDTFGLREKLADALALTGSHADARGVYAEALASSPHAVAAARLHRKSGKTLETEHDHAQALHFYGRAEEGLNAMAGRDTEWHREWVQVHLNRIWIFYWQNRTADMNELVAHVEPAVNEHASALQRSNYYQALVTRDFRLHRYVVGDEVIVNARRSLAAAEDASAPVETVFARFVLGFALLFAGQLEEADAQLFEALQSARRLGDVTSALRCQAYLALTQRRQHRVNDAEASARDTLAIATSLKMNDYVGLAQGILGWAAWTRGNEEEARRLSQAARESWASLNFPYPFQWTGGLTLLAVQLSSVALRTLVGIVEPLLAPGQLRLPEPINAALEEAVAAYGRQDSEAAREALQRAVAAAKHAGFL